MKRRYLLLAAATLAPLLMAEQQENVSQTSPVERRVAAAEHRIQADPKSWQPYNELAFALCRWARDNDDVRLYDRAQGALDRSLQLLPGGYDAKKLQVTVLLGKHEFAAALKLATELNQKVHDDIGGWGLLVDANVALGEYDAAERAAQWILDLRRGSSLGFSKAAGLRELFGDFEGAIEFFDEAARRTAQSDADERAWLLTQNARLQLASGNANRAEELLNRALKLFPDSQLALANLAAVRVKQRRYSEAVSMYEKHYDAVPNAVNLYEWSEALEKSGEKERASAAFEDFETKARAEMNQAYNANRELIFFYTDRKNRPAEALALAERERAIRHDAATCDAYAWALYRNAKYTDAKKEMDRALAVGVRDPVFFCHAAQIAAKTGDTAAVARYDKELAGLGENSCAIDRRVETARPGMQ